MECCAAGVGYGSDSHANKTRCDYCKLETGVFGVDFFFFLREIIMRIYVKAGWSDRFQEKF